MIHASAASMAFRGLSSFGFLDSYRPNTQRAEYTAILTLAVLSHFHALTILMRSDVILSGCLMVTPL